jgi:hypothetical protein
MSGWLAVIVFCIGGQCKFWANTSELYNTEKECSEQVFAMEDKIRQHGIEFTVPGCIPVRLKTI